jgi:hypothetical protein
VKDGLVREHSLVCPQSRQGGESASDVGVGGRRGIKIYKMSSTIYPFNSFSWISILVETVLSPLAAVFWHYSPARAFLLYPTHQAVEPLVIVKNLSRHPSFPPAPTHALQSKVLCHRVAIATIPKVSKHHTYTPLLTRQALFLQLHQPKTGLNFPASISSPRPLLSLIITSRPGIALSLKVSPVCRIRFSPNDTSSSIPAGRLQQYWRILLLKTLFASIQSQLKCSNSGSSLLNRQFSRAYLLSCPAINPPPIVLVRPAPRVKAILP